MTKTSLTAVISKNLQPLSPKQDNWFAIPAWSYENETGGPRAWCPENHTATELRVLSADSRDALLSEVSKARTGATGYLIARLEGIVEVPAPKPEDFTFEEHKENA